jgi:uncharacterized membrane-anchored protein YitT (DUF2179 family)
MKQNSGIWKETLFPAVAILCGNTLLAFLVAAFVIPHGIIMGGTTGIAIVLNRFFGMDTSDTVLILNLAMLLLGALVLGKKFFLTTVVSSVLYPVLLGFVEEIPGIANLTTNPLLAALFGGGLLGVAVGMVMRVGSSTGGTDVLNLVLHKLLHLPISVLVYITDIVILGGQALFCRPEQILYGIAFLVVETFVLNQVMLLGKSQIQLLIISDEHEKIRQALLHELHVGVTMMMIENGISQKSNRGVISVIPRRKLYDAEKIINTIDPNVFMTITQIKEVRGQGFTRAREEYAATVLKE